MQMFFQHANDDDVPCRKLLIGCTRGKLKAQDKVLSPEEWREVLAEEKALADLKAKVLASLKYEPDR